MRWIVAKISTLIATVIAAIFGGAASQAVAFTNAYLQRLTGHLDEARRYLENLRSGEVGRIVTEPVARDQLLEVFQRRVTDLEAARDAIVNANAFMKPIICFYNFEEDIGSGTLDSFVPAIPLDLPSLVYGVVGIAIGLLLWDVSTWPFKRWRQRRNAKAV